MGRKLYIHANVSNNSDGKVLKKIVCVSIAQSLFYMYVCTRVCSSAFSSIKEKEKKILTQGKINR